MVKTVTAAKTARKRNRKRKRRVASSSESSSSSSEDSSSGSENERPVTVKLRTQVSTKPVVSEDSSSSFESDSSDEGSVHLEDDVEMADASAPTENTDGQKRVVYSRSPSPVPAPIPSFLPTKPDGSVDTEGEQQLGDRFRKFWMQSVADAFQDDLVQIHKVGQEIEKENQAHSSSLPRSGTRNEQISAGNAGGFFGFRCGCFHVKLLDGNARCERDGRCYGQSDTLTTSCRRSTVLYDPNSILLYPI